MLHYLAESLGYGCHAVMASTRKCVTGQGFGSPEPSADQGEKAGPQASSSGDRSLTPVGNLANVESNATSEKMDDNDQITLPFNRTSKAKNRCLICLYSKKLVTIPPEAKLRIFINRGIIIQGNTRL